MKNCMIFILLIGIGVFFYYRGLTGPGSIHWGFLFIAFVALVESVLVYRKNS